MPATPKTLPAATRMLERYAIASLALADIESSRSFAIAAANAEADHSAGPLIKELTDLETALEPWWNGPGKDLAGGKKSVQLGGCMVGIRKGKPSLAHTFPKDDDAATALLSTRYKKQTTRVKYSLDKVGTLKLLQLGGKAGELLQGMGFSEKQDDRFFVERVEQPATISA